MLRVNNISVLLFVMVIALPVNLGAEIYKYKDAQGNWQFTDKPPPTSKKPEISFIDSSLPKLEKDLSKKLTSKFNPTTAIEKASLSVIQIKTPISFGSGFFISEDGYLITNKHVIRPELSNQEKIAIDQVEEEIKTEKANLKNFKKSLDTRKKELDTYKKMIRHYRGQLKRDAKEDYESVLDSYKLQVKNYNEQKKALQTKEKEFKTIKRKTKTAISTASYTRNFEIRLKDNTKLMAELITISKENDLALLKVEKYKTPFLETSKKPAISQGMNVYAIGSPLGETDSITSGVITKIKGNNIITDTTILPGNRGISHTIDVSSAWAKLW